MKHRTVDVLLTLCTVMLASCVREYDIPDVDWGSVSPPPSGYEVRYEPEEWNDSPDDCQSVYEALFFGLPMPDSGMVQCSTNCYAYVLDYQENPLTGTAYPPGHRLQPGEIAGNPVDCYAGECTVDAIVEAAKADATATSSVFQEAEPNRPCPTGLYRIALVIDPDDPAIPNDEEIIDYHWYRQNPDGTWSAKGGHTQATDRDAAGNTILDPRIANRDYSSIGGPNYTEFGGYYCVAPHSE